MNYLNLKINNFNLVVHKNKEVLNKIPQKMLQKLIILQKILLFIYINFEKIEFEFILINFLINI